MGSSCLLCLQQKPLKQSHVVPAFVSRYFRETSVTGRLRSIGSPNLPQQDIHKSDMFCEDCEQLMGIEDKYFAENIFYPIHKQGKLSFDYNFHLARFCAIQSFRVLAYIDSVPKDLYSYGDRFNEMLRSGYEHLRLFVHNRDKTQDRYYNYIILFDTIESLGDYVPDPPDHINKYLIRTIDFDVVADKKDILFIYSKMCKIAIMTFVSPQNPEGIESARILEHGKFPFPQTIKMPGFLDFLFDRASHYDSYFQRLSSTQAQAIRDRVSKMENKILGSETHRASIADKIFRYLKRIRKS